MKREEREFFRLLADSTTLWNLMTALRGPDFVAPTAKFIFTARYRALMLSCGGNSSYAAVGSVRRERTVGPFRLRNLADEEYNTHFADHAALALGALRILDLIDVEEFEFLIAVLSAWADGDVEEVIEKFPEFVVCAPMSVI